MFAGRIVRHLLEPTVYVSPVKSLLTPAEQRFYETLDQAVDGQYHILSKVRIADMFELQSSSGSARQRLFWSIACKHIDFLLVEHQNFRPVAGLELDDNTHQRPDRRNRDQLLDELFAQANIPLLRFRIERAYREKDVLLKIREALNV
ncbi:MAG: DUF2726 domain-containing protein [Verrucomicrobia bacterium]|nr:DUF2726 domain-containing protein [Verrucomicrobiota bacterium]MBV9671634.1 DUF2726 domain-containing protein [Verrucomicrobiota bacterium]